MSFDWQQYYNLALALEADAAATAGTLAEAKIRSAISRAYYAAHHKSKQYVETTQRGVRIAPTGNAHQEVIDHLKHSRAHNDSKAGALLERLAKNRRDADYRPVFPGNVTATAQSTLMMAKNVRSRGTVP